AQPHSSEIARSESGKSAAGDPPEKTDGSRLSQNRFANQLQQRWLVSRLHPSLSSESALSFRRSGQPVFDRFRQVPDDGHPWPPWPACPALESTSRHSTCSAIPP